MASVGHQYNRACAYSILAEYERGNGESRTDVVASHLDASFVNNNVDTQAKETPLSVKFAQAISEEMMPCRCCCRLASGLLGI